MRLKGKRSGWGFPERLEGGKRVEKALALLDKKCKDLGGLGKWDDGSRTRELSSNEDRIRRKRGGSFKMENSGWGIPEFSEGGKRVEKALALLDKKYTDFTKSRKWDDWSRTRDLLYF